MAVKSSPSEPVLANLDGLLPELETIYKDIHSHPELSMQEERTAGVAADHLRAVGYEVTTGVGKTGVVGLLHNGDGPTVMLRADMDALPVQEATGLPYASTVTATDSAGKSVPVECTPVVTTCSDLADRCGQTLCEVSRCLEGDADRSVSTGRGDGAGGAGDD